MPFTFLPHQAAVLPLKLARPHWFSGTALVFGSMAPDLEYFVRGEHSRTFGHTMVGQFTFCLPLTLLLVWLITRVVAQPLALHMPDGGPFHLRDYRLLATGAWSPAAWLRAGLSALIGSFSHLLWDSFTHRSGWMAQRLPPLQGVLFHLGDTPVEAFRLLQHSSSILGGAVTLALLYRIGKRRLLFHWRREEPRSCSSPATAKSSQVLWTCVSLGALVGLAAGVALHDPTRSWTDLEALGAVAFKAVTITFLGLCAGCALASRRMDSPALTQNPSSPP